MIRLAWAAASLVVLLAAACVPPPEGQMGAAMDPPRSPYRAVLVAGERDVPVFDHATAAMRRHLLADHVDPLDMPRLTATREVAMRDGLAGSSLDHVLGAVGDLRPMPGQACLVYITSHGGPDLGLVLAPRREFLTPAALDDALVRGCGDAPTVVIASGCYSGNFARPPMARANRIVLTAARADRPSFGCGAGFDYTVYDRCLLGAMDRAETWRAAYGLIQACVGSEERRLKFPASGPQAWFGDAVRDMGVGGRPGGGPGGGPVGAP